MNGPQHAAEAKRLVDAAHDYADQHPDQMDRAHFMLERASIHVGLAQLAQEAERQDNLPAPDYRTTQWADVFKAKGSD